MPQERKKGNLVIFLYKHANDRFPGNKLLVVASQKILFWVSGEEVVYGQITEIYFLTVLKVRSL